MLVEAHENTNLIRASGNLPGVKLVGARDVNVYDVLKYRRVLLSESAARKLSEALA
ncbi:MAG: 50S ribosomal protein L4 [Bryobacteraceae bacterium]